MKKQEGIILSVAMMILGFLLNGLAWTVLPGPNLSTFALIAGLGLTFVGFVFLIINLNKI